MLAVYVGISDHLSHLCSRNSRFTSYTAGIMITHHAARQILFHQTCTQEMELSKKSLAVLSYCAEKNSCAQIFHSNLSTHLDVLQSLRSPSAESHDTATSASPLIKTLFGPCTGPAEIHSLADNLLDAICHPLGNLPSAHAQASFGNQAEMIMGTHLEWQWELRDHVLNRGSDPGTSAARSKNRSFCGPAAADSDETRIVDSATAGTASSPSRTASSSAEPLSSAGPSSSSAGPSPGLREKSISEESVDRLVSPPRRAPWAMYTPPARLGA